MSIHQVISTIYISRYVIWMKAHNSMQYTYQDKYTLNLSLVAARLSQKVDALYITCRLLAGNVQVTIEGR